MPPLNFLRKRRRRCELLDDSSILLHLEISFHKNPNRSSNCIRKKAEYLDLDWEPKEATHYLSLKGLLQESTYTEGV
jgi:hypothetical protein